MLAPDYVSSPRDTTKICVKQEETNDILLPKTKVEYFPKSDIDKAKVNKTDKEAGELEAKPNDNLDKRNKSVKELSTKQEKTESPQNKTKQSKDMRILKVFSFPCDCFGVVSLKPGEELGLKGRGFSRDFLSKEKHIRSYHEGWIECTRCNTLFENTKELKLHEQDHEYYKCNKCNFDAKNRNQLSDHRISMHKPTPSLCPMCGEEFPNSIVIRTHKKRCVYRVEKSSRINRISKVMKFSCECPEVKSLIEGEQFGIKGKTLSKGFLSYERHIRVKHENWFGCSSCNKSYGKEMELFHHNKVHKQVPCEKCDYMAKHREDLSKHIMQKHDPKPSDCQICGKLFDNLFLMRQHKKQCVDAGDKTCEICGGSFKQLARHMKVSHTTDMEKIFKCNECEKGFVDRADLNSHNMSVHIKSQPYQCRYGCENRYNDSSNRYAHEKRRHGQVFNCNLNE